MLNAKWRRNWHELCTECYDYQTHFRSIINNRTTFSTKLQTLSERKDDLEASIQWVQSLTIIPTPSRLYLAKLRTLQAAKSILDSYHCIHPEVNLHLSRVLVHFGRWAEAVTLLQEGLRKSRVTDPRSKMTLKLVIGLVETYIQMANWKDAQDVCESAVLTWNDTAFAYEYLCLLFLYEISYQDEIGYKRFNHSKLVTILAKKYIKRLTVKKGKIKCILYYLTGELMYHDCMLHALIHFWKGLTLGKLHLPASFYTTYVFYKLGYTFLICNFIDFRTELSLLHAFEVCTEHFPYSMHTVLCRSCLSMLSYKVNYSVQRITRNGEN